MSTRKDKDKGPKGGEYKEPGKYEPGGHEPPPPKEEKGAVEIHRAYLEHRLAGGEPATPEAYRRAVEQFEKLPGAMRTVPPPPPPEKPADEDKGKTDDKKGEQK